MNEFEKQIQMHARAFEYPPTPEISWPISRRRSFKHQPALRLALVVALFLMLVPLYVALEQLQIGVIRIEVSDTTPIASPVILLDLPGQLPLAEVQRRFSQVLKLPANLPEPDYSLLINRDQIAVLIWLSSDKTRVEWILYQIPNVSDSIGYKTVPNLTQTRVHGYPAIWLNDPHILNLDYSAELTQVVQQFVSANVLIWSDDTTTYRLETESDMESARAIAESL